MCMSLQEVYCGWCTFKYEITLWAYFGIVNLWGYPHIESHSNARVCPKKNH